MIRLILVGLAAFGAWLIANIYIKTQVHAFGHSISLAIIIAIVVAYIAYRKLAD